MRVLSEPVAPPRWGVGLAGSGQGRGRLEPDEGLLAEPAVAAQPVPADAHEPLELVGDRPDHDRRGRAVALKRGREGLGEGLLAEEDGRVNLFVRRATVEPPGGQRSDVKPRRLDEVETLETANHAVPNLFGLRVDVRVTPSV